MVNLEVVGRALDAATKDGKFGAYEHTQAMQFIAAHYLQRLKESDPSELTALLSEQNDCLARIGNVSAIRQHGEKFGYVSKSEPEADALARAVFAARTVRLNGKP